MWKCTEYRSREVDVRTTEREEKNKGKREQKALNVVK